ncbi:unnamed protein product [Rotaria sordida]|uniref:Uncharacterized protein n=1 Tax=Rotaria sordida TaxID=392033 RepID=A0A814I2M5_9BILA|nr:unnamed protein product [Rotaria sordida]CAF1016849.1 unnamed protein product [Rotaria sordida]CAF1124432.1 unnamed protein product [Rotaria sordida]CAF1343588.1 unnamed protein product [Rotaria sordida]CAF4178531.1 unnamed protein product [Rotaria sordida]
MQPYIESKKAIRTYVLVENARSSRLELNGFTIFDSKEKTSLYQLTASRSDIDSAVLFDNSGNKMIANLEGIWIGTKVNVTFSIYDSKLNKWTDGIIRRTAHWFSVDFIVEYNNEQVIANRKSNVRKVKVYHKKKNELLAEFRLRPQRISVAPHKYDMEIYSNKAPDAIHFFLLLIIDHRIQ